MPFCHNCGTSVSPQATVCHRCSTILTAQLDTVNRPQTVEEPPVAVQPAAYYPAPEHIPASGRINVGLLVWSIINNAVGLFHPAFWITTMVLSVIALVNTCTAPHAVNITTEHGKIRAARVLNIIATAVIGFVLLLLFAESVGSAISYNFNI